jgi:choline dehydrogenase-like flavoprotein
VVNFGELSNSNDLALYMSAFSIYIKNINEELKKIDPNYELIYPDPKILNDMSKLEVFIKKNIQSDQHVQSHCRMASLADGGVVDSTGRVYGVNNLIVADNSVSPKNMDGSPMANAYLIAERIKELLLGH